MSKQEKEKQIQGCDCQEDDCSCDTITLEMEDGSFEKFIFYGTLEHQNKHYIALAPLEGEEYFIYGLKEAGEEMEIFPIDDMKELEVVAEVFEQRITEEEEGE